jgi:hypothetical protein
MPNKSVFYVQHHHHTNSYTRKLINSDLGVMSQRGSSKVHLTLFLIKHHGMRINEWMEMELHEFLTLAPKKVGCWTQALTALPTTNVHAVSKGRDLEQSG